MGVAGLEVGEGAAGGRGIGDAMLAVVVADPTAARRALAHLESGDAHGAVLSLGAADGPSPDTRWLAGSAGESVRAHVRAADPRVAALLDELLAGAVRVSEWGAALDASLAHPDAIVVTDDGHRFSPTGWRLGAAGGGATAAALDDAHRRAETARDDHEQRERQLRVTREALVAARQAEADLARRLDANDARFTACLLYTSDAADEL